MRWPPLVAGALLLLAAPAVADASADRPADYTEFRAVATSRQLRDALRDGARYLYLSSPAPYTLDNPIVVARDGPLFIHGASRVQTVLRASDPSRPLFRIERSSLVNFSNLSLVPDASGAVRSSRAVLVRNEAPLRVELEGVSVDRAVVEISGPGSFVLQGCNVNQLGVQVAIVVDHPEADVLVVGGDITNMSAKAETTGPDHYHAWVKRGRFRIYGTTVEDTAGRADFRIDTRSKLGPHVIADVRSEGSNGVRPNTRAWASSFLYVPPSSEAVDVVLKNNSAAWAWDEWGRGHVAEYNAAGTLWVLATNGFVGIGRLVIGDTRAATLVVAGNVSYLKDRLVPTAARARYVAGNIYNHVCSSGGGKCEVPPLGRADPTPPKTRFVDASGDPAALVGAPLPPPDDLPPPVVRPRLTAALPGMIDVTRAAIGRGAAGDGVADDTAALQAALDAACGRGHGALLYLPAGTYRITRRLAYNGSGARCSNLPPGGWIAGAGRDRTRIVRDRASGAGLGVFRAGSMHSMVVQGISFETAPFSEVPGAEPNFDVEFDGASASQQVVFHDVRFDGGRVAWGTGLTSPQQCSSMLLVDAEFRNAQYGFASGSFNALANIVYSGTFVDNDYAVGQLTLDKVVGGTWYVYRATSRGTRIADVAPILGTADAIFAWRQYASDANAVVADCKSAAGGSSQLWFERASFAPRARPTPGRPLFWMCPAGALTLAHSTLARGQIRQRADQNSNVVVLLDSEVADWPPVQEGASGRILRAGRAVPGQALAPAPEGVVSSEAAGRAPGSAEPRPTPVGER